MASRIQRKIGSHRFAPTSFGVTVAPSRPFPTARSGLTRLLSAVALFSLVGAGTALGQAVSDLSVDKTASVPVLFDTDSDASYDGTNVTYTIEVTNNGPAAAPRSFLVDTIDVTQQPGGFNFTVLSVTSDVGTCNIATPTG